MSYVGYGAPVSPVACAGPAAGAGLFTSTGAILVLFILLVIISRAFVL